MPTTRRRVLAASASVLAGLAMRRAYAFGTNGAEGSPRPLRILILGGTGFTGPHQVRYALGRGHKVTLFNRGKEPQKWPGQVEELIGDRNTGDLKALEGREWDVCIDNPTMVPFWVRDVGRVLHGKVKQYIFISTIGVHAAHDKPADETAPVAAYTGKDPMAETLETLKASGGALYGPLKVICEQEAEKQFPGMTTVVRPGLIVGPGDETDRFTYWPVRLDRGGEVLAPGDGTDPVQVIDARDLAEWMIRMAEARTFGVFNATGPAGALHMRSMLDGIATAIKVKPQLTWVPAEFLKSEKVTPFGDMPVWMPAQGDFAGFYLRDVRKALAAGLTFRPFAITAADTLEWFKQQPAERQATMRAGMTREREQEVLAHWKAQGKAPK
jgi:2'-hydroxyisoflavone reductase